jgi:MYXO-CTERM domain-containing protein
MGTKLARLIVSLSLLLALGAGLISASRVMAQEETATEATGAGEEVATEAAGAVDTAQDEAAQVVDEDDDGFDWGLLGLLGLLGLAGLLRRPAHAVVVDEDLPTTRTRP